MIVDSGGRSAFGVSCSQTFLEKSDKVECSVKVGDRWKRLDPRRDWVTCSVAASCVVVVCSIPCSQSVSSALPEVRKMDICMRDVLKAMEC